MIRLTLLFWINAHIGALAVREEDRPPEGTEGTCNTGRRAQASGLMNSPGKKRIEVTPVIPKVLSVSSPRFQGREEEAESDFCGAVIPLEEVQDTNKGPSALVNASNSEGASSNKPSKMPRPNSKEEFKMHRNNSAKSLNPLLGSSESLEKKPSMTNLAGLSRPNSEKDLASISSPKAGMPRIRSIERMNRAGLPVEHAMKTEEGDGALEF